jgi:hypothetical protein
MTRTVLGEQIKADQIRIVDAQLMTRIDVGSNVFERLHAANSR